MASGGVDLCKGMDPTAELAADSDIDRQDVGDEAGGPSGIAHASWDEAGRV